LKRKQAIKYCSDEKVFLALIRMMWAAASICFVACIAPPFFVLSELLNLIQLD
jgi:hypothetical protein